MWVGRKRGGSSRKLGGCVDKRQIEQDVRFMSGKGSKERKSDRSVSVQTGRLLPTPETEGHRQPQARSDWDWVMSEAGPRCRDRIPGNVALGGCRVSGHSWWHLPLWKSPDMPRGQVQSQPGSQRSGLWRDPYEFST